MPDVHLPEGGMKTTLESRRDNFIFLIQSAGWVLVFFGLNVVALSFLFYAIADR